MERDGDTAVTGERSRCSALLSFLSRGRPRDTAGGRGSPEATAAAHASEVAHS